MIPRPHVELVRCRVRATFTSAIMNEWNGIIMGATHSRNTSQLYRVLVRESLNPATEARSTTPAVPMQVTKSVLRKRLGYRIRVNALMKFSPFNRVGNATTFAVISENVFSELMTTRIKG